MAEDAAGAVRRTPRPSDHAERHDPGPDSPRGATNATGPIDHPNPYGERGTDDLSAETSKVAEALAELRAKIQATAVIGDIHTTDDDLQAFIDLPECTACGGTGKDDHATAFEAPLAVHFAGPPVRAEGRRRQLCMWCGHVLADLPSRKGETLPEPWLSGALVRVEDGVQTEVTYEPDGELPPGCCALPDDEPQAFFEAAAEATGTTVGDVVETLGEMVAEDRAAGLLPDEPEGGDRG